MGVFALIMALLSVVGPIVALLGSIVGHFAFTMEWGWTTTFFEILDVVFFLIPVYDLWPLLVLVFTLGVFRFLVALLRTVMDIIPLT